MTPRDLGQLLRPLVRRLQAVVQRGVVSGVDDGTKMQTLQVRTQAGAVADGVEHMQPWGLAGCPLPGAEHVTVALDGDASHSITIVVADRRYRLTGLAPGEVALHDDRGMCVHLTRAGLVFDCKALPAQFINCPTLRTDGAVIAAGSVSSNGGANTL